MYLINITYTTNLINKCLMKLNTENLQQIVLKIELFKLYWVDFRYYLLICVDINE